MPPKTIGLIAHPAKPGVANLVNAIAQEFGRFSISILVENETAKIAGRRSDGTIAELRDKSELLVDLGGDGTILHVADQMGNAIKPLFGIKIGQLRCLTCSNPAVYRDASECSGTG